MPMWWRSGTMPVLMGRHRCPSLRHEKSRPTGGAVALLGVIALCAAASAFLLITQRPDGKAAISQTTAAALPSASASPPPTSSSPHTTSSPPASSTAVPAVRRTNTARNESEPTRRSFQSCSDLATQRGWGSYEARGKTESIAACMRGQVIEIDACLRARSHGGVRRAARRTGSFVSAADGVAVDATAIADEGGRDQPLITTSP